jgi:methionine-rich copper-binding protein CopC
MIFHVTRFAPLVAALLLPVSASAHAILIDSSPPIRATVPTGHVAFTLHYNSRVDRARSRLTLIAPDKTQTRLPIGADGAGDVMTTAADLAPGDYVVRWQVLATDGHITRGDLPFTVQAP